MWNWINKLRWIPLIFSSITQFLNLSLHSKTLKFLTNWNNFQFFVIFHFSMLMSLFLILTRLSPSLVRTPQSFWLQKLFMAYRLDSANSSPLLYIFLPKHTNGPSTFKPLLSPLTPLVLSVLKSGCSTTMELTRNAVLGPSCVESSLNKHSQWFRCMSAEVWKPFLCASVATQREIVPAN